MRVTGATHAKAPRQLQLLSPARENRPEQRQPRAGVRRPLDFGGGDDGSGSDIDGGDAPAPEFVPALPLPSRGVGPAAGAAKAPSPKESEGKPARRQRAVWRRAPIPMDFEIPAVGSP